jgi:hypothetical protein
MSFETIRYERLGNIGTLTLARPDKRSAQNPPMWEELGSRPIQVFRALTADIDRRPRSPRMPGYWRLCCRPRTASSPSAR